MSAKAGRETRPRRLEISRSSGYGWIEVRLLTDVDAGIPDIARNGLGTNRLFELAFKNSHLDLAGNQN